MTRDCCTTAWFKVLALALVTSPSAAQETRPLPIIDVHLHALSANAQGPPPLGLCAPFDQMPVWDQRLPYAATFGAQFKDPPCADPIWSPTTDEELKQRTLAQLEKLNVYGVLSGTPERVEEWSRQAPQRFLAGLGFRVTNERYTTDYLRELHASGKLDVLAEITNQYEGIEPSDPRMQPYWSLAEELDIPVGIHIGTGPPGAPYLGDVNYRARLHSALTVEEVLVRHPKLRLYIMHAGYPMLDDLLAVLYTHPQVHVGIGVIVYTQPREAFYRYLKGIVDAGFVDRVMFGSDQMVWPEAIERGIAVINECPFLSDSQKRAILYDNAARFLRLDEKDRARHHGAP